MALFGTLANVSALRISRTRLELAGAEGLLWPGMAHAIPKAQIFFSYPHIFQPSSCIQEAKKPAAGVLATPRARIAPSSHVPSEP